MDEERYLDPTSMPQHIDEGETRYQQEEGRYEVNEEWTEAIVREEEYGELEKDDIIIENTEEVYEVDDEQQMELQDELEKGTNQIQIEPSDILTSDIVNEGTETDVYGEDDEALQDELEIRNENTEKEVYEEHVEQQLELQDELEKGTNEIQIEPSDTLTSDIVNEDTETDDEQLQDESEIINVNTEEEVYEQEEDEQLQNEKGINEIQIEPSDILTSDNLLTEKTKEMAIQDNSKIQENGDDDDQSYSPPLQPQINKEKTPDYLGDDEQLMIKTPPSSTSSKKITPSSRDSKGKRRSSDKVNYVFIIVIIVIINCYKL